MSVFWIPKHLSHSNESRGFTLLEVLTVLFIIGLIAAFVAPNFPVLVDRIVNANERDTLIRSLNTLPYRALEANQDLVLLSSDSIRADRSEITDGEDIFKGTSFRAHDIARAEISLPAGWSLSVDTPIFYRVSGFCAGGTLKLNTGLSSTSYKLAPPLCQLVESE